jgi:hypothetical protein
MEVGFRIFRHSGTPMHPCPSQGDAKWARGSRERTAPTIAQYEVVCPRRWLTSMMPCATLRLRHGEGGGPVAQGRVGQDWAALGGLAKFPNGGAKSALFSPRATHKSQPRNTK